MKMIFNKPYLAITAALMLVLHNPFWGHAQNDFTLYNMSTIPQVSLTNPATMPKSRVNIGLPVMSGIYLSTANSGFTLGDALEVDAQGQTFLDVNTLKDALAERNYLTNRLGLDLFTLGFRVANNYLQFHARTINEFRLTYPRDAFIFLIEGNGQSLLGERASFDGFGVDVLLYNEYGASFTRRLSERLTIGMRYKYLYGFAAVYTRDSKFGITTDLDYNITIDGSFEVNTAGVDSAAIAQLEDLSPADYFLRSKNTGSAFDFGARFKLNEQLELSGSIVDLGRIRWRENARTYTQSSQEFVFDGIDIGDVVGGDGPNTNPAFDNLVDSLTSRLDVQESETQFNTPLSTKIYLGATYNLTNRLQLTALTFNQIVKGAIRTSFSAGLNTTVGNFFGLSANYSAYGRSFGNIGLGVSANLGPMQLYLITDNLTAPLNYDQRKNFHFRFGLNLTFGRDYEN